MNFNHYASDYSLQIEQAVGSHHQVFVAEKAIQLKKLALGQFGNLDQLRVLDVGCGIGLMERNLQGTFLQLTGVDIAEQALDVARQSMPGTEFIHYDDKELPFADDHYDVVFAVCVFHHVPPGRRLELIREMARVTSPDGLVVVFEHNPLNPVTQWIVARCEIDRDAILLGSRETTRLLLNAGLTQLKRKHILFFPWRGRFWTSVESVISWVPIGTQYYASGQKAG